MAYNEISGNWGSEKNKFISESMESSTTFGFPFRVNNAGRITGGSGDEAIRGKIIQVLFTAPGERVHQPEFGCGLFNLVFEPNNDILAAATEFTVTQALARWLENDILVDAVAVEALEENVIIEVAYTKRSDLSKDSVRVQFR